MLDGVSPTPVQARTLAFRQHAHICNAGGRGSGKSFGFVLDVLDHCRDFGSDARPLVLRESWAGLQELSDKILSLAIVAFGPKVQRNKAEGTVTLPNGAVITLSNIADEQSYSKLQGRTFTALFADEAGNYPPTVFRFMQRVRSNLRVPPGRRAHIHLSCNPFGRSHSLVFKSYVSKAAPFTPFLDEFGDFWVVAHSTYRDNPHIDREAYERQLRASCGGDEALLRAWLDGDWNVLGGCMFDVFEPATHLREAPRGGEFYHTIGADWGTASPCAAILLARMKHNLGPFRNGDIFALDECDTCVPDDLSTGDGSSVTSWADQLHGMVQRNKLAAVPVVTDDMRGLTGDTVVRELQACGHNARRPVKKDRVGTWALIRTMLQSAAQRDSDRPALWISSRCPHLIETLAEAPSGTLRPEDIDSKYDRDHHLDALAYGVRALHFERAESGTHHGMY